jgi:NNP family nitrate/nitrite transporter-like MFS transporter
MAKLEKWEPENPEFWKAGGSKTAWRNLIFSVPSLLCAFSVWMVWSIITVKMKDTGFPFTDAQLFTIVSIAGLSGATLRIPNSFLVALAGGRNVVALTTAMLLAPAIGAGIALQNIQTPFSTFVILALLSGVGGGNFSSSMSNINGFFPKRLSGLALGLNAGIGNLGVSVMQFLVPVVMGFALFGALSGNPYEVKKPAAKPASAAASAPAPAPAASASAPASAPALVASAPASVPVPAPAPAKLIWPQNGALVWVPLLIVLALASFFGMNNLPAHDSEPTALAMLKILFLHLPAFASAGLIAWILMHYPKLGLSAQLGLVLLAIALCLLLLKLVPGKVKTSLDKQFSIFAMKDTWVMTLLYIMTFGSFIGYSAAFPLTIKLFFGKSVSNPATYAFIGPLVGSLIRPVGGWLSDKFRGSRVTQWSTIIQIVGVFLAAHYLQQAQALLHADPAADTHALFLPVLLSFLLLFLGSGIGNGSTFQMVPFIFPPQFAGPVLGWTGAVAAYGSYVIPTVFKTQIAAGTVQYAFYGFAVFYIVCLVLNGWFYARKGAVVKC